MTPQQKALVQSSFAQIMTKSDLALELFYRRLFELDPNLQLLFQPAPPHQRRQLAQIVALIVKGLDYLEAMTPTLQAIGRRHLADRLHHRDYDTIGAALSWTLEQTLGAAFTPEIKEAWMAVYTLLTLSMQAAVVTV